MKNADISALQSGEKSLFLFGFAAKVFALFSPATQAFFFFWRHSRSRPRKRAAKAAKENPAKLRGLS
jgi:hypothetical protein